jgi:UDP-2,4-diacetamido-2,4,6-trideoxy-beta-L-altropyranose hydrolase
MKIQIKFRCDFGYIHGLGHFKRCLNLANNFKKKKISSTFVIKKNEKIIQTLLYYKHSYIILDCKEISLSENPSWNKKEDSVIVFDSRNINNSYLSKFKYGLICCFDDNDFRDLNCSVLINSNIWVNKNNYTKNNKRSILSGLKYNTVDENIFLKTKIRNALLLTLGGEDPNNLTLTILKKIRKYFINKKIYVIIGPFHPDKKSIYRYVTKSLNNCELVDSPTSLDPYYKKCDLAITACGTTIYELMASGISFGYYVIEKHQESFADFLTKKNLGYFLGNFNNNLNEISERLSSFSNSNVKNNILIYKNFIKFSGLDNISNKILKLIKH